MLRVPIWATAFVLFAGGSLAAPSLDVPLRVPRAERPAPAEDWSLEGLARQVAEEVAAEDVVIARKRGGGGGHRGGASRGNRGGFSAGNQRHEHRNVNRDVDVDRDVNVYGGGGGNWDDDDNAAGAALLGGVIGLGVGSMIANDPNN